MIALPYTCVSFGRHSLIAPSHALSLGIRGWVDIIDLLLGTFLAFVRLVGAFLLMI